MENVCNHQILLSINMKRELSKLTAFKNIFQLSSDIVNISQQKAMPCYLFAA